MFSVNVLLKMYIMQSPESVVGLYSVLCYCPVSYLQQFYVGIIIKKKAIAPISRTRAKFIAISRDQNRLFSEARNQYRFFALAEACDQDWFFSVTEAWNKNWLFTLVRCDENRLFTIRGLPGNNRFWSGCFRNFCGNNKVRRFRNGCFFPGFSSSNNRFRSGCFRNFCG